MPVTEDAKVHISSFASETLSYRAVTGIRDRDRPSNAPGSQAQRLESQAQVAVSGWPVRVWPAPRRRRAGNSFNFISNLDYCLSGVFLVRELP